MVPTGLALPAMPHANRALSRDRSAGTRMSTSGPNPSTRSRAPRRAAARAQLQLSEARYTQGLGSQIELADAQTAVTTAEGNLVQAEFQLASAWAQRHRAVAQQ